MTNISIKENIKVARVENPDVIIINAGYNDGITEGMRFLVYKIGEDIIDPDSNTNLGPLEILKGKYKVGHIQEKISTLFSETKSNSTIGLNTSLIRALGNFNEEDRLKNSIVTGDLVKLINSSR